LEPIDQKMIVKTFDIPVLVGVYKRLSMIFISSKRQKIKTT
jgi:hypothetical protein